MKRLFAHLFLLTMLFVGAAFVAPEQAHAQVVEGAISLLTGGVDIFYGLVGKIFWWVLIPIAGYAFQLLGLIIDTAVALSLESSFYNSPAIGLAWSIIRDICNMVFIFVLIYEGIRTILNIGNSATVKRTITSVIIAAVLLNFSLFFTKVVIDASNIASTWFIQGIQNIGGGESVSGSIRAALEMEKLTARYQTGLNMTSFSLEAFTTGFLLFILTCVALYVFFNVVFLLIGRIVAFTYLLIMSPLGFIGLFVDIPQIKDYGKEWRDELMAQAMMLPMFFLMVYITLFIVDRADKLIYGTSAAIRAGTAGSQEFAPINYVFFIIIIMMLLRALKTAQKYSGEIGEMVAGTIKSMTGVALGGLSAAGGVLGRQTIGRKAFALTQDEAAMSALQAKAATSFGARMQLAATKKLASSSFDARKTAVGGGLVSSLKPKLDIPGIGALDASKVGKTEEKGYKGGADELKKREADWAKENLGDGKEGAENRIRYAQSMANSRINKALNYGSIGGYSGAYKDMAKKAKDDLAKAEKEGAKKKANAKKNQVVMADTALKIIEGQKYDNDPKKVAAAADMSKALVSELKADLEKEGRDSYLKFVRGFEKNITEGLKQAMDKEAEIVKELAALQAQKANLANNPSQNKDDIADTQKRIDSLEKERSKASEKVAAYAAFADKGKSITAKDREEAAKKFAEIDVEEWEKSAQKHITHTDEIMSVIGEAEKALAEALRRDADIAAKKAALAKAQTHVKKLIGETPEYEQEKGADGKPKKGKKKKIVPGSGKGLKLQAAVLKEAFKEKDDELTVESKEKKDDEGNDDEKNDSEAEGGGKK